MGSIGCLVVAGGHVGSWNGDDGYGGTTDEDAGPW